MDEQSTKKAVREAYARIARGRQDSCCGGTKGSTRSCCGGTSAREFAKSIGYSEEELLAVPEEANLSLGCGNPTALAGLREGETVLDLGSGGGFDCFLAAKKVGSAGRVIGVDMTPEMVEKARANVARQGFANVEFRLGEIENLPVADGSVDVVISNCVINLSSDKPRVFQEIRRVLKPGGRVAISDMALLKELPEKVRGSMEAYAGCVGGALLVEEYERIVEASGLKDVRVTLEGSFDFIAPDTQDPIGRAILDSFGSGDSLGDYVASVYVEGSK